MTLKWMANRFKMVTWTHVNRLSYLHRRKEGEMTMRKYYNTRNRPVYYENPILGSPLSSFLPRIRGWLWKKQQQNGNPVTQFHD